jgi:hypothetical protein
MTAEIINLGSVDEEDKEFINFLEELKTGSVRATYIIEREDGTVAVGCTGQDRKDMVFDIFRLQEVCRRLISEV